MAFPTRYKVMDTGAAGGFGRVVRARDSWLERDVAVKVLDPLMALEEAEQKRFQQEARILAQLSHPNIPSIYDIIFEEGSTTGEPAFQIVFEFIAGRTLDAHLRECGAVTLEEAKHWFSQLASALQHAHSLGVVHRDVKPANIIVREPDGSCCLVDFGIALRADEAERLTREGYVIGTPGYMSPEQMRGDEIDHATDIYSLAVCLYEALAGVRMQPGQYVRLSSINESIPVAIDELIEECLADRDQRLDDLNIFMRRLNEALRPKAALSSVLSEGRLADLQAALAEMTPEEFRDRPAGQRALIVARIADLAQSGDSRLEMPIVHHLNLLVHLGARLNPDEYREVIQIALEWGFTHQYQNGDIGKSSLRQSLAREASTFATPVHRMVTSEVVDFFGRAALHELDEWRLNGARQVVSNLLANRACDEELVAPLVALRRRVDGIQRGS